jgi:hypothetical protein
VIFIGIDDTDILGSRGTNQLARAIVRAASGGWRCLRIVRHQLLDDPRIPYTSKNGSASITLEPRDARDLSPLIELCRNVMREWFVQGSDPGLCVTEVVPDAVTEFGWRCKREVVTQQDARRLAFEHGIHLEGLGGTEGGVIGSLAAVGLAVTGNDGRIVQLGEWPDDLSGVQSVELLTSRGVEVKMHDEESPVTAGLVDIGKHLRPNRRSGRNVLFVQPAPVTGGETPYQAIRLT